MLASTHALSVSQLVSHATRPLAAEDAAPLSPLVWWLIPLFAFIGAIGYVIWVSKFQTKYENQTNRSVGRFQNFQRSLEKDRTFSSAGRSSGGSSGGFDSRSAGETNHLTDRSGTNKMTDTENSDR